MNPRVRFIFVLLNILMSDFNVKRLALGKNWKVKKREVNEKNLNYFEDKNRLNLEFDAWGKF